MKPTLTGQLGYMFQRRAYQRVLSGKVGIFSWKTRSEEKPAPDQVIERHIASRQVAPMLMRQQFDAVIPLDGNQGFFIDQRHFANIGHV